MSEDAPLYLPLRQEKYDVTVDAGPVYKPEPESPEPETPRTPPPVQRFPIYFDTHIEVKEILEALACRGIELAAASDGTWIANRPPIFHLVKAD